MAWWLGKAFGRPEPEGGGWWPGKHLFGTTPAGGYPGALQAAMQPLEEQMGRLGGLQEPYGEGAIQSLIGTEMERLGGAQQRGERSLRGATAGAGLWGSGVASGTQRLLREEMTRRRTASEREQRLKAETANRQFQLAIAGLRGGVAESQAQLLASLPAQAAGYGATPAAPAKRRPY